MEELKGFQKNYVEYVAKKRKPQHLGLVAVIASILVALMYVKAFILGNSVAWLGNIIVATTVFSCVVSGAAIVLGMVGVIASMVAVVVFHAVHKDSPVEITPATRKTIESAVFQVRPKPWWQRLPWLGILMVIGLASMGWPWVASFAMLGFCFTWLLMAILRRVILKEVSEMSEDLIAKLRTEKVVVVQEHVDG